MKNIIAIGLLAFALFSPKAEAQGQQPFDAGTFTCTVQECASAFFGDLQNAIKRKVMINSGCRGYGHNPGMGSICRLNNGRLVKIDVVRTGSGGSTETKYYTAQQQGSQWILTNAVAPNQNTNNEVYHVWYNTQCHGAPALVVSSMTIALQSGGGSWALSIGQQGYYESPVGGWCWAIAAIGGE